MEKIRSLFRILGISEEIVPGRQTPMLPRQAYLYETNLSSLMLEFLSARVVSEDPDIVFSEEQISKLYDEAEKLQNGFIAIHSTAFGSCYSEIADSKVLSSLLDKFFESSERPKSETKAADVKAEDIDESLRIVIEPPKTQKPLTQDERSQLRLKQRQRLLNIAVELKRRHTKNRDIPSEFKLEANKEFRFVCDSDDKTGYTPKKGEKEVFFLMTPTLERHGGIRVHADGMGTRNALKNAVSTSTRKNYATGVTVFAYPLESQNSFLIDADQSSMTALTEQFLAKHGKDLEFGQFLTKLSLFVNQHIKDVFKDVAIRGMSQLDLSCRHYAYFSAILFSKIMEEIKDSCAEIQVLCGNRLDNSFVFDAEGGHAWTFITRVKNGETTYWYFDAYNYAYVELKAGVSFSELTLVCFDPGLPSGETEEFKFNEETSFPGNLFEFFKGYVTATLEKTLNKDSEGSLYHEKNRETLYRICEAVRPQAQHCLGTDPTVISEDRSKK